MDQGQEKKKKKEKGGTFSEFQKIFHVYSFLFLLSGKHNKKIFSSKNCINKKRKEMRKLIRKKLKNERGTRGILFFPIQKIQTHFITDTHNHTII